VLKVLAPHLVEEQEAHRRRDKAIGLVIIGVTFVLCILGSLWGKELAEPEVSQPPRPPTTEGVVGWPNKVEAIATLPAAREATQREELRGIVAEHVSADGTIDFEMTGAEVRYSFQSAPGRGPQPAREPGTVPRRSYCGKQNVFIRKRGLVAEADMAGYPCSPRLPEPLPPPQCSIKDVWDFAIKNRGVPTGRPARIEYYRAKQGPAYRFTLPGTQHRFSISADCSRELVGGDVFGGVP